MLMYVRYSLATVCLALSMACLGLWWFDGGYYRAVKLPTLWSGVQLSGYMVDGTASLFISVVTVDSGWKYISFPMESHTIRQLHAPLKGRQFMARSENRRIRFSFPIWFPALVSALAGIGALRLGRRFTLRTAIVATTVVVGLLGLAAAL